MATADLKKTIELLYTGGSRNAARFRYGLISFDIGTIIFFIATTHKEPTTSILVADVVIGLLILTDFVARLWIAPNKRRMLCQIYTITDIVVILSLLLAPLIAQNLSFLRILRSFRLLHSYHVLRDLRRETPFFRRNEDVLIGSANLGIFIFLVTALVFALQADTNPGIDTYIDALYFTVSALTTTGFGDITLAGNVGKLLAVFIMLVGVALFLRLAQAIFRPKKVNHPCATCGLTRHDPDAVHCKHCGQTLKIETEGEG